MKQNNGTRLLYSCLDMRKNLNQLLSTGKFSHGEFLVLRNIWEANVNKNSEHLKAAKLSDALELSRPSVTRILNSLEERRLIKRNIDINDRRSISINLTEKGIKEFKCAEEALKMLTEKLVQLLGDEDTSKLIDLVNRLSVIYKDLYYERGE